MHRDQFSEKTEPLIDALIHWTGTPLLKQTGTHGRIALVLHPLSRLLIGSPAKSSISKCSRPAARLASRSYPKDA